MLAVAVGDIGAYIFDVLQLLLRSQDEQLDMIGSSVGVLKNMSQQIGSELEDQNM